MQFVKEEAQMLNYLQHIVCLTEDQMMVRLEELLKEQTEETITILEANKKTTQKTIASLKAKLNTMFYLQLGHHDSMEKIAKEILTNSKEINKTGKGIQSLTRSFSMKALAKTTFASMGVGVLALIIMIGWHVTFSQMAQDAKNWRISMETHSRLSPQQKNTVDPIMNWTSSQ